MTFDILAVLIHRPDKEYVWYFPHIDIAVPTTQVSKPFWEDAARRAYNSVQDQISESRRITIREGLILTEDYITSQGWRRRSLVDYIVFKWSN